MRRTRCISIVWMTPCTVWPMNACNALYGGLTMLNDVMAATDRFVSFN